MPVKLGNPNCCCLFAAIASGVEVVPGSSAGSAVAAFVKALRTRKAKIGERSMVPPNGGIIPRNMFKYGSQIVLQKELRW